MIDVNNNYQTQTAAIIEGYQYGVGGFDEPSRLDIIKQNSEKLGKFSELKKDIGDTLYNSLSDEDRTLMVETAGTIDFGHSVDLDAVAKNINEYGYSE